MRLKVNKNKAQEKIEDRIKKASGIIEDLKQCKSPEKYHEIEGRYSIWINFTKELLLKIFPTKKEKEEFRSLRCIGVNSWDAPSLCEKIEKTTKNIKDDITKLNGLIERLEIYDDLKEEKTNAADFWRDIHPKISVIAKARFINTHYADAVESALKEINTFVKDIVKRKTSKELDGADLMHTAFFPKNPIIVLDDLSTETGKNIQQGYMEIFAGTMIGIRNPKAHGNIEITKNRAKHSIYLASLLMYKLDKGI